MRRGGGAVRTRAPVIDGEGYTVKRDAPSKFAVGDRVFHQKFGTGTVTSKDGDKLEIDFDHAGTKRVIEQFVTET